MSQVFLGYNCGIMLKNMALFAISATLATIALTAQPNKGASQKEGGATHENPTVVLAAPDHQGNTKAENPDPGSGPPRTHTTIPDPNWFLFGIGCITCVVIGWQSWETRKSAKATKISAEAAEKNINLAMHMQRGRMAVEVSHLGDFSLAFSARNIGNANAKVFYSRGFQYALIPKEDSLPEPCLI
jgi:hypothetical protein